MMLIVGWDRHGVRLKLPGRQQSNDADIGMVQARFPDSSSLMMLPGVTEEAAERLAEGGLASTGQLVWELHSRPSHCRQLLERCLPSPRSAKECLQVRCP
jgi:hypothetical protein